MKRTFFNVGQGLFAVEEFNGKKSKTFTMVYDCGTITQSVKKKNFNVFFNKIGDRGIDVLFISHLHEDHINMISDLLNNKNQKNTKIYLPGLTISEIIFDSIFEFLIDNLNSNNLDYSDTLESKIKIKSEFLKRKDVILVKKHTEDGYKGELKIDLNKDSNPNYFKKWCFIPFFRDNPKVALLLKRLCDEFPDFFSENLDEKNLLDFVKNNFTLGNRRKIREIYLEIFPEEQQHNFYSMIVYSGPIGCSNFYLYHKTKKHKNIQEIACLYTGDFYFKDILPKTIKKYYGPLYNNIGVFQSPHHGSKNNHDIDLYNQKSLAIICYGIGNIKYNHPDKCVLSSLKKTVRHIIPINENTKAYSQYIRKI